MSKINTYTDCSGCDLYSLPAVPTCVIRPYLSQVTQVIILPNAAQLPSDWTMVSSWESVISNASTSIGFGRVLNGKGGVSEPTETSISLGKIDRCITRRRYTLDFEVTIGTQSREFLRKIQRGNTDFTFWYFTAGEWFFGGINGVKPLVVSASIPLLSGATDFELGKLRIEFASDIDPDSFYFPGFSSLSQLGSAYLFDDGSPLLDDDGNPLLDDNDNPILEDPATLFDDGGHPIFG
jgi:hypothetical protein